MPGLIGTVCGDRVDKACRPMSVAVDHQSHADAMISKMMTTPMIPQAMA
jgi:hypothetical protein